MVKAFVFQKRGGELLDEFEPADLSWEVASNAADLVTVTIDLESAAEATRGWRNLATPWKHCIAVDLGGRVVGGPIMPSNLDDDKGEVKITARGIRVPLAKRSVLPLAALTTPLTSAEGVPDTSLDSTWAGYDLGTIGMLACQQAFTWPGWDDIPVVWPAPREGSAAKTYPAIERRKVDRVLSDLSQEKDGPDFRFQLRWADADRFEWVFESGSADQPRLQSPDVVVWEIGQGAGLRIDTNPTRMGSLAWSQGGRAADTALVRMLYDPTLIERGFPLLEIESGASVNIVDPDAADAWNVEALRTARVPWEFWSFDVPTNASPFPHEYNVGDLVEVIVTKDTPISGGWVPPGVYTRRIVKLSGGWGDWLTITCGEIYEE